MRRELGLEPTEKFLNLVQMPDTTPQQGLPVPRRPPVRHSAGQRRQPMRVL